ncbi:hypothetical protein QQ045_016325 [Rhodiola kirilowii]
MATLKTPGWDQYHSSGGQLLINGAALSALPELKVHHLARIASNHCPLLISLGDSVRRPSFMPLVESAWRGDHHINPILNFALKLKALRKTLKQWNWEVFGNMKVKLNMLLDKATMLEQRLQGHWQMEVENELALIRQEVAVTQRNHYHLLAEKAKTQWIADAPEIRFVLSGKMVVSLIIGKKLATWLCTTSNIISMLSQLFRLQMLLIILNHASQRT